MYTEFIVTSLRPSSNFVSKISNFDEAKNYNNQNAFSPLNSSKLGYVKLILNIDLPPSW